MGDFKIQVTVSSARTGTAKTKNHANSKIGMTNLPHEIALRANFAFGKIISRGEKSSSS